MRRPSGALLRSGLPLAVSGLLSAILAVVVAVTVGGGHLASATGRASAAHPDHRPSIVLVLMDDASYDLLRTMPQARRMQADGATYLNTHVVDSLCCPSRAAIFTGQPPHLNGVHTNTVNDSAHPLGGYTAFAHYDNQPKAFNVSLQRSGYTTAFIGKYMNGYDMYTNYQGKHFAPAKVPGWDVLEAVLGGGYPEWGFRSTYLKDGMVHLLHDRKPLRSSPVPVLDHHYATNWMSRRALAFLHSQRDATKPYFLEVATYGPHAQMKHAYHDNPTFPSAFADRAPEGDPTGGNCGAVACARLSLRDLWGYDDPRADNAPTYLRPDGSTTPAPPWNTSRITLTARGALKRYRDRARMVQSVDRMLARIRAAVGPNTYVMLMSDNGFHLGQLQLNGGKGTPYDFDTHVPLVVDGPGVTPGPRKQFVSSMDLASTFESLAGVRPAAFRTGTSITPTFAHPHARGGRFVFMEHTYAQLGAGEVDSDTASGGDIQAIPSYVAVRGKRGLLVRLDLDNRRRHADYAWELYRYDVPWENTNVFANDHDKPYARVLMRRLGEWIGCAPAQCRAATR